MQQFNQNIYADQKIKEYVSKDDIYFTPNSAFGFYTENKTMQNYYYSQYNEYIKNNIMYFLYTIWQPIPPSLLDITTKVFDDGKIQIYKLNE